MFLKRERPETDGSSGDGNVEFNFTHDVFKFTMNLCISFTYVRPLLAKDTETADLCAARAEIDRSAEICCFGILS